MSEKKVTVLKALERILEVSRASLEQSQFREIDSLIDIIYREYGELKAQHESEGQFMAMDKCVAILLGFYGMTIEGLKEEIDELNAEGLSPVKKVILPTPIVMGLELEFDTEAKFPEVE